MARTAKAKADSEKTSTKSVAASQENEETAVGNAAVEEPVTEQKEGTAEAPKKKGTASPRKRAAKKTAKEAKPAEETMAEAKPAEEAKPEEAPAKEAKPEEAPKAEMEPEEAPAKEAKPEGNPEEEPKAEESKEEAPADKAEEKPKKASTKKSDTAKKPARGAAAKKADAKKEAEKVEEIYVQFNGQEITTKDILEKVKQAHKDNGHRIGHIKSTQIYIKPEDGMAYYVINGKYKGEIPL